MRRFVVVDRPEAFEASLLRDAVAHDGRPGLRLQRAMEALVGAVLLGARELGANRSDAEPDPPAERALEHGTPTVTVGGIERPEAQAQLHRRITPMLLALAFALLAVPMARSSPRQARHGRLLLAFLAYLVSTNMLYLGTQWLAEGKVPALAGLWWLSLPMLALAAWLYFRDGQVGRPQLRLPNRAAAK